MPEEGLIYDIPKNREVFKCPICNKIFIKKRKQRSIGLTYDDYKSKENKGYKIEYYKIKEKKRNQAA